MKESLLFFNIQYCYYQVDPVPVYQQSYYLPISRLIIIIITLSTSWGCIHFKISKMNAMFSGTYAGANYYTLESI